MCDRVNKYTSKSNCKDDRVIIFYALSTIKRIDCLCFILKFYQPPGYEKSCTFRIYTKMYEMERDHPISVRFNFNKLYENLTISTACYFSPICFSKLKKDVVNKVRKTLWLIQNEKAITTSDAIICCCYVLFVLFNEKTWIHIIFCGFSCW